MNTAVEAVAKAKSISSNVPGTCQLWVRNLFLAPSAGDQDGDGDADAVDGWKSEPANARHYDKNPPLGAPLAWAGGRNGYGHRAIHIGGGNIRHTDAGGSGRVGTTDIDWVQRNWGLIYLGWSETITGQKIDFPEPPKPTRGYRVDLALRKLRKALTEAERGTARYRYLERAIRVLQKIEIKRK